VDTDGLNRWLTLVANIGVLIGLIILIVEIGQNTDMMRAQMTQSRADQLANRYDNGVHSAFWPAIRAKRDSFSTAAEWIESLSPEEYYRVYYSFLREYNDIRNQFFQYQEGYLPQRIWETSSRGQIGRMLELAPILSRGCNADLELQAELNRIAAEEGLPQCLNDVWQ
jgi:hypothetical protein